MRSLPRWGSAHPLVDRVSAEDLMSLAADTGSAPMQVGAALLLSSAGPFDVDGLLTALGGRLPRVPRLRQRLINTPLGGGRPIWVDDPGFELGRHLTVVSRVGEDLERAALDAAAELITTRLDRSRPLWAARLLVGDGAGAGSAALVLVFHHVVADGIAGLAMLAALSDEADPVEDRGFPRPRPAPSGLRRDAAAQHLRGLLALPAQLVRSARGLRLLLPGLEVRAAPTSLNRPTGERRRFVAVHCALDSLRAVELASGATINDVLLTAIAGAISEMLLLRGEHVGWLTISVPFSGRRRPGDPSLGNHSGIVPFVVPTRGPVDTRLSAVHAMSSQAKRGERGSSSAVLGPASRLLARTPLYRSFIDSQRMVNTFVTNVRGPADPLRLAGVPIIEMIPLSVATGNVSVAFAVLSYAGGLTVTLVADPDVVPDLDVLRAALVGQLADMGVPIR
jgi:diacylglycerol O-acyltransferase / wax synthase